MTTKFENLTLVDAMRAIQAAVAKADAFRVPCSVAVVDAGGHLLGFARQDDAMPGSAELAINKAYTARIFNNSTEALGRIAQPGAELYGIQQSHAGRVVMFGGGLPICIGGVVVGAVGVSGGSVAQDVEIAETGTSLFVDRATR